MPDHGEIPMPGGWLVSTMWTPVCGQGWADTAACFIGMWSAMMVVMMLPSIAPVLWRARQAWRDRGQRCAGALVAMMAAGYFGVCVATGAGIFVLVAALVEAAMQFPALARAAPVWFAAVVLLAGGYQFTAAKSRELAGCRPTTCDVPQGTSTWRCLAALRHGMRLGGRCTRACAGLTAILLVVGVMDWRAMAVVGAAITAERLAPQGERVAWVVGALSLVAGVYLMTHALWS
ncbi:DUF2182 domain-containing protein [Caenimonas koreensis]|nr:DUF2182 domain-containing protein [Caenimonas koreensis]